MPHTGLQILPCSRRIIQCLRRADVWKGPALVAPTWSWGLIKDFLQIHGGFHRWGYPKIDCFYRKFKKILSKWMIWGYPYFRKPPHGSILAIAVSAGKCSIYFHHSLHIIYQLIRIQSRSGDRNWVSTKDAVEHEGLQSELLQILLEPLSVSLSLLGAIIPGKKRPGYCTYIYISEPPIGTQKCVPFFFCPISKNVPV